MSIRSTQSVMVDASARGCDLMVKVRRGIWQWLATGRWTGLLWQMRESHIISYPAKKKRALLQGIQNSPRLANYQSSSRLAPCACLGGRLHRTFACWFVNFDEGTPCFQVNSSRYYCVHFYQIVLAAGTTFASYSFMIRLLVLSV